MNRLIKMLIGLTISLVPLEPYAFDSGSTGADGALNPTADTELQLPPSGIFNFTTIDIPADVALTFAKNAANVPVILLASGDVNIIGTIDVSGANSADIADADLSDDGMPGGSGPGGFDGGRGGFTQIAGSNNLQGGTGRGPGGGRSPSISVSSDGCGGGGAGFNGVGGQGNNNACNSLDVRGAAYGTPLLIPLVGGSGGGGGSGGKNFFGNGGGGGGGGLLIATSATLNVIGTVNADGGDSGSGPISIGEGGKGGGGSGGAIRLVATTIIGEGTITAKGGSGTSGGAGQSGGNGADGRIALETENLLRGADTTPSFAFFGPQPVFVANLPSLTVTEVAGIAAPASPTGVNDIVLPENTPNPADVTFATTEIPLGSTIALTATPTVGSTVTVTSTPVSGTQANGTATASIDLPNGPSVLTAAVTVTVTAALGSDYSKYAQGERVERVRLVATVGDQSRVTFITASGKEHTWPSNAVAMR